MKSGFLLFIVIFLSGFSFGIQANHPALTVPDLSAFEQRPTIVSAQDDSYVAVQRYDDGRGEVVFYRSTKTGQTLLVREQLTGGLQFHLNYQGNNRFFSQTETGTFEEKFLHSDNTSIQDSVYSEKPDLAFAPRRKNSPTSRSEKQRFYGTKNTADDVVYTSFVVPYSSLQQVVITAASREISVEQVFAQLIDFTNLLLVNSEIYDFRFALGEIIVTSEVYGNEQPLTSTVNPVYRINKAILEGKAERIVTLYSPDEFPGIGGFANLWPFIEDDYEQGALLSEPSRNISLSDVHVDIDDMVLAHEIGHSMGLKHERESKGVTYDFAIPYGFTTEIERKSVGSVMMAGGSSFDRFSNPDLTIGEQPLGISETEINAADASTFLRKTWPLTTTSANLMDLNFEFNRESETLTVSWQNDESYTEQQLIELNSEYCADFVISNIAETHVLTPEQNSLDLPLDSHQTCLALIGFYDNQGVSIPQLVALRQTPDVETTYDLNTEQQIFVATPESTTNILVQHSILPSDSQWQVAIEDATSTSSTFVELVNSRFSHLLSLNLDSQTEQTSIDVSFTQDPKLLSELLSVLSAREVQSKGLRLRIRLCAGNTDCISNNGFLSETYVTLNTEALLPQMPHIALDKVATLFINDSGQQTITGVVHNISAPEDVSIKVAEGSVAGWQINSSEVVYDDAIDGVRFSINVSRPEQWLFSFHALEITVPGTNVSAVAPVFWPGLPKLILDTPRQLSVIDNELFAIAGTIRPLHNAISELFISVPVNDLEFGGQALPQASIWTDITDDTVRFRRDFRATREGTILNTVTAYIAQFNRFIPLGRVITHVLADEDNDGMADEWELQYGLDPTVDDSLLDADNDGVSNLLEYQNRTSPLLSDTDSDGVADGDDAFPNDGTRSELQAEQPSNEIGQLAWKKNINPGINNQLVAGSDQIYLLTELRELSAYDIQGNWLWSYNTLSNNPKISVFDDIVYLSGDYSSVEAVSKNGEPLWEQRFASSWLEKGLTPVRSNGDLLVTSALIDGGYYLVAMNLQGEMQWQLEVEEAITSIGSVNQQFYLVLDNANALQVSADGAINWQFSPQSGNAYAGNPGTMALDRQGNLYYAIYEYNSVLIAVDAQGEELWRNSSCCTHGGVAIDSDGTLWTAEGGQLTSVNTATGEDIRQIPSKGDVSGFVVDQQGSVISGTNHGYVTALLPQPTRFSQQLWQYNVMPENQSRAVYTQTGSVSSPILLLDNLIVFLTEAGQLVALNTTDELATDSWASTGGDNGNSGAINTSVETLQRPVAFDYDGDGIADIAVRRASSNMQYLLNSANQQIQRVSFGAQAEDIPITGDFDGDGIADIAVRRPSTQYWYIKNSSGNDLLTGFEDGITRLRFGLRAEDIPVPADYDGDGITDIAVRRPSTQMWYIQNSSGIDPMNGANDGVSRVNFGKQTDDLPVPADYDGDGKADIAVRRPSNQMWYILNSADSTIQRIHFGKQANDIPVPADYDGDGMVDIAVRRPSNQMWYILNSSNGEIQRINFGKDAADIPVAADYDGDGIADIAVRRSANQMWYILNSSNGEIQRINFGKDAADIPLAAPIFVRQNMVQAVTNPLATLGKQEQIRLTF